MPTTLTKLEQTRYGLGIPIVIWGMVQALAWWQFGIRQPVDTPFYIDMASNLLQGTLPVGGDMLYLSYALLLSVFITIGIPPVYAITFHLVVSLLALICLYLLTKQLIGNPLAAFGAALLFALWFKFQQWNLILYTDAVFTSCIVISAYTLLRASTKVQWALGFILILFTSFLRPPGAGLLVASGLYTMYRVLQQQEASRLTRQIAWMAVGMMGVVFMNVVMGPSVHSFIDDYATAEVIYPDIQLFLEAPSSFVLPNPNYPAMIQIMAVFWYHPIYMLKITFLKMVLFLGHIKPYYSWPHNLFIACYLYPCYLLAVMGWRSIKDAGLKLFLLAFIAFQILMVSLTTENWDGRFLLPVLPLVFVLAGIGVRRLPKFPKPWRS